MSDAPDTLTALQKVASAQPALTTRFNTDVVRAAFNAFQRRRREAQRAARSSARELGGDTQAVAEDPFSYAWIEQLWTDHLIVKIEDGEQGYFRIPFTIKAPGTSTDDVSFGAPEQVRQAYVAASRGQKALDQIMGLTRSPKGSEGSAEDEAVALARVRTMAGARRYRKPIGTQLGSAAPGGDTLATVARAASHRGAGSADRLRDSIQDVSREKSYKGGQVFGDIGSKGKLKSALGQIANLPDGKRGAAAAEVVKAAQSLGLTALVPSSVKRLYREYIAQGKIKEPSKATTAKGK